MGSPPRASVVVATRDREPRLAALLDSLAGQSLAPGEFEVIVVDDGSNDGTAAVLEAEIESTRLTLTAIRRERSGGPAAARNAGWQAASAPVVAFTDDDCRAAPDWLSEGLRAMEDEAADLAQGRTDPDGAELGSLGPFSRTMRVHELGPWFQTCNVFYRHEALERLGGFDEELRTGEDADLAWRAIEAGLVVVHAPAARTQHAVTRLGPLGKLRVAWRWSDVMAVFARHPGARRAQLTHHLFWNGSHYLLCRALLAFAVPRRLPALRIWLARPYLLHLLERGRTEGGGPTLAPYFLVQDLVELAAALRGSARHGRLVL